MKREETNYYKAICQDLRQKWEQLFKNRENITFENGWNFIGSLEFAF